MKTLPQEDRELTTERQRLGGVLDVALTLANPDTVRRIADAAEAILAKEAA